MKDTVIQIENISKIFYKRNENFALKKQNKSFIKALNNISLNIYKGDTIGLIGYNGSGKSTLLKLIANVYKPTTGKILTKGKILPILENGLGFHKDLSGYDNLIIYGRILGLSSSYIKQNIDNIAEFAEMKDYLHMPIKHYSNGMISRLSFSIIPHIDADIYLFDEVLVFGDQSFQIKIINFIKSLQEKNKTIIIVSHNILNLVTICNRIIVLRYGTIILDTAPYIAIPKYIEQVLSEKNFFPSSIKRKFLPVVLNNSAILNAFVINPQNYLSHFSYNDKIHIHLSIKNITENIDAGFLLFNSLNHLILIQSLKMNNFTITHQENIIFKTNASWFNTGTYLIYPFLFDFTTNEFHLSQTPLLFQINNNEENTFTTHLKSLGTINIPFDISISSQ